MHQSVQTGQLGVNWSELFSLYNISCWVFPSVFLLCLESFALPLWYIPLDNFLNVIFPGKL